MNTYLPVRCCVQPLALSAGQFNIVGCAVRTKSLWLALVRTVHPTDC